MKHVLQHQPNSYTAVLYARGVYRAYHEVEQYLQHVVHVLPAGSALRHEDAVY
jgi:hypothetical protein